MAISRSRQKRNPSRDLTGRLRTQTGPRTTAPMWPRPFFTPGEWAVYTALWSYPNDSVFPTHQDLADRAWVERGTAADAIAKMDREGLLEREACERDDGSQSSNTYYLVEVPSAAQLAKLEDLRAARAADQDEKRKKRKAAKRKYEKQQLAPRPEGGYDQDRTPERPTRGTAQTVPRGSGARRTPGGTAQAVPGSGAGRTHETLGVTPSSQVTDLSTHSPKVSDNITRAETGEQEKDLVSPEIENQEGYASDGYPLTLSPWEAELVAELGELRPDWSPRSTRIAVGHPSVRARGERNQQLVRRVFLLAAADRPKFGRKEGTWSPKRVYADGCPLWGEAVALLEAEASASVDQVKAARPAVAQPSRRVAAPSAGQESPSPAGPSLPAADAKALARAEIARGNAAKASEKPKRSAAVPPPRPSDDAAARAATEAARAAAAAALAERYPGEVPAPA